MDIRKLPATEIIRLSIAINNNQLTSVEEELLTEVNKEELKVLVVEVEDLCRKLNEAYHTISELEKEQCELVAMLGFEKHVINCNK